MPSFEKIVRPFQLRSPLSSRKIVASNTKRDVGPAIVSFGAAGAMPGAVELEKPEDTGANFTVIMCDDRFAERSRKVETVKIAAEDDPDTFIEVDRPNQIRFEKTTEQKNPQGNSEALPYVKSMTAWAGPDFSAFPGYQPLGAGGAKKCLATYFLTNDKKSA